MEVYFSFIDNEKLRFLFSKGPSPSSDVEVPDSCLHSHQDHPKLGHKKIFASLVMMHFTTVPLPFCHITIPNCKGVCFTQKKKIHPGSQGILSLYIAIVISVQISMKFVYLLVSDEHIYFVFWKSSLWVSPLLSVFHMFFFLFVNACLTLTVVSNSSFLH